ncbi:MAG: ABC transporter permease, partial [Gaiellales bacterium]
ALGLTFGTIFDPRNVPLMFGIVILPLTFLGGTYYAWTTLEPVKAAGLPWLQYLVLINPLVYINEGSRAALTSSNHMTLWAVYPALIAFSGLFLWVGTRNFTRRVIS